MQTKWKAARLAGAERPTPRIRRLVAVQAAGTTATLIYLCNDAPALAALHEALRFGVDRHTSPLSANGAALCARHSMEPSAFVAIREIANAHLVRDDNDGGRVVLDPDLEPQCFAGTGRRGHAPCIDRTSDDPALRGDGGNMGFERFLRSGGAADDRVGH